MNPLKYIKVVSQEEAEKVEFVVCAPAVGVAPVAGSIKVECSQCKADCWLAPSAPVKPKKVCIQCFIAHAKKEQAERLNAGQITITE